MYICSYHLDDVIFTEEDILCLLTEVHNVRSQGTPLGITRILANLQITMQNIPVMEVLHQDRPQLALATSVH